MSGVIEEFHRNGWSDIPVSSRSIDEYIAGFPHDVPEILKQIRTTIRKAAPDAEEAIKYQIPTFVLNGNLVHFAAFKDELSRYESAKGSIQFPIDTPMPLGLIAKTVKFRVKEVRAKSTAKKNR